MGIYAIIDCVGKGKEKHPTFRLGVLVDSPIMVVSISTRGLGSMLLYIGQQMAQCSQFDPQRDNTNVRSSFLQVYIFVV